MLITGLIPFALKISLHQLFILMTSSLMPAFQASNNAPCLDDRDILNSSSTFTKLGIMLGNIRCISLSTLWKYTSSSHTDISFFFLFKNRGPDDLLFFSNYWVNQTCHVLIQHPPTILKVNSWQNSFSLICPLNLPHNTKGTCGWSR